jgi:FdhD protein
MGRLTRGYRVRRLRGGEWSERPDTLVVEEPLEIRVGGRPYAVTMRTPGNDFDLAAGFLVAEGVVGAADEIATITYCSDQAPCAQMAAESLRRVASHGPGPTGADRIDDLADDIHAARAANADAEYNVVDVTLGPGVAPPRPDIERSIYTSSSCGVCGKAALDAIHAATRWPVGDDTTAIKATTVAALPGLLRAGQRVFARTGGLHAAGVFTADGTLVCLREDVGRHNAVDKILGWAMRSNRLPLRGHVLQVSGRASFELVQKAVMAGIPLLSAVSAPSSLAVDLAAESGLTLAGFVRENGLNVYAHAHRVIG